MYASEYGRINVLSLLVSKGANINHKDRFKMNALLLACKNDHINIVKLLLANNVNNNTNSTNHANDANDIIEYNPITYAVKNSNIEMVKLLLLYGDSHSSLNIFKSFLSHSSFSFSFSSLNGENPSKFSILSNFVLFIK
jgi:ankyrin repeat protein